MRDWVVSEIAAELELRDAEILRQRNLLHNFVPPLVAADLLAGRKVSVCALVRWVL